MLLIVPIFFACEEIGEIGFEVDPNNQPYKALYQEIDLDSYIVKQDSTSTSFSLGHTGYVIVGRMVDEQTGTITSTASYELIPAGSDSLLYKLPADAVFDSIKLSLRVTFANGSDEHKPVHIKIFELAEEIQDSVPYTRHFEAKDNLLAEATLAYDYDTNGYFNDTTYLITLSDELGERFVDKLKNNSEIFKDLDDYREFFKGISIQSSVDNTALLRCYLRALSQYALLDHSRIYLYSHSGSTKQVTSFPALGKAHSHYVQDASGSPVEGIESYKEFTSSDQNLYLQGGISIFTKIPLSNAFDLLESSNGLLINRADLEIYPDTSLIGQFDWPQNLTFSFTDNSNGYTFVDYSKEVIKFSSYYSYKYPSFQLNLAYTEDSSLYYRGQVEPHLQHALANNRDDLALIIKNSGGPIAFEKLAIKPENIKLKVYYSSLEKE